MANSSVDFGKSKRVCLSFIGPKAHSPAKCLPIANFLKLQLSKVPRKFAIKRFLR